MLLAVLVGLLGTGILVARPMFRPAAPAVDLTHEPGAVVELDPITFNLADGRYLKAGLALQLSEAATRQQAAHGSSSGASSPTAAAFDGAKALDAAISILGARSFRQLLAAGGRKQAQDALSQEVRARYGGQVLRVYFTQFVMQ
jgi:flagellar FliL protein